MPLDVWTKNTVADLLEQDGNGISICSDLFKPMYEKYEKEKLEHLA